MHRSLSINTLSLPVGSFESNIDRVARLGARAISPDLEQLQQLGAAKASLLIRDAGLAVATLTHRSFGYATPAEAEAARERLMRTIDEAATLGAKSITMTTGGRGALTWASAAERFAEAVAPCGLRAREAGVALGIEPTSHLYADASIAHSLSDSLRLAQKAGISIVIDIFACWFDADIEQAIGDAGHHTVLVQISDYVYGDRGLPCRAVPGDGAIPLDRLVPAIVQAGFQGYFDLEIIGPRLAAEGSEQGLFRAAAYMGKLLESAGLPAA